MIRAVNIWQHYGVAPVLKGIDLEVATGELLVVMGPNGMGKSSLLGVLGGALSPIEGYVEIDGLRRRSSVEAEREIRRRVCYLPDEPYLPPNNTGREMVFATGRVYGVGEQRMWEHAERLFELFDLSDQADKPIRSYSAGQKKKIGLACALITDRPNFILDEPFSGGLDSSALLAMREVLSHLAHREDVTVVMAVPVPELVEGLADRLALVHHGRIVAHDTPDAIKAAQEADTLAVAIERLLHPESGGKGKRYLEAEMAATGGGAKGGV